MKDAHIAEQMGVKRAYFSQLVNGLNVSDQVVDRMCSAGCRLRIRRDQVALCSKNYRSSHLLIPAPVRQMSFVKPDRLVCITHCGNMQLPAM